MDAVLLDDEVGDGAPVREAMNQNEAQYPRLAHLVEAQAVLGRISPEHRVALKKLLVRALSAHQNSELVTLKPNLVYDLSAHENSLSLLASCDPNLEHRVMEFMSVDQAQARQVLAATLMWFGQHDGATRHTYMQAKLAERKQAA